jgi:hypothetical protein
MYGSETWKWLKKDEREMNAIEMRLCEECVEETDRVRNEKIRDGCNFKMDVVTRTKVNKLRWFGHIERINEERMKEKIYMAKRKGVRKRGRPRATRPHTDQILKDGDVTSRRNRRACMRNCMNVREVCQDRLVCQSILSPYPSGDMA